MRVESRAIGLGGLVDQHPGLPFRASVIDRHIEATKALDGSIHQGAARVILADAAGNEVGGCRELAWPPPNGMPFSWFRPEMAIWAPSRASAAAVARPMPVRAPV